jgi:hypothetical protein
MRFPFFSYVFLLPFFSSPYLYSVFRSWSINYSLLPMLVLLGLFFIRLCCNGKLQLPSHGLQRTTSFFGLLQIYSIIITLVASLVLELSGFQTHDVYRSPAFNSLKELLRAALTFIAFYLVVTQMKEVRDVWRFIRVVHISLAVLVVYGYLQIVALVLPDSIPHSLLEAITPLLDQGWQGELRETFLYIDGLKRVNLLTPEASTAAQILEVYFLPLLLASILSGVTVWQRRILGMTLEMLLLLLVLPLIVATLSSPGFVGLFVMLVASLIFSANNRKKFAVMGSLVGVSIGGIAVLIYSLDIFDLVWFMVTKVTDTDVGSTNTRYALLSASFDLFLHNPWGVGTNNNNVLMAQYVPSWGQSNPEIIVSIANENLPTLNLWLEILSSIGLVGFIMLIIFFVMLWRKNVNFRARGVNAFAHYAFVLFIISFVIHGFNTASTTFLWMWSICGFYAVMGHLVGNKHPLKNCLPRVTEVAPKI